MKKLITKSGQQTQELGQKFGQTMEKPIVITLRGQMGAGKTEFTKGFTVGAGSDLASSPTFTIMNVYEGGVLPIYHFDFYRLEGSIDPMEFNEYIYGDGVCIIEWSEFLDEKFDDVIEISFNFIDESSREIQIEATGSLAKEWMERIL